MKKKKNFKYFECLAFDQVIYRKLIKAENEKEAMDKFDKYMNGRPKVYDYGDGDYKIDEISEEEYKELKNE